MSLQRTQMQESYHHYQTSLVSLPLSQQISIDITNLLELLKGSGLATAEGAEWALNPASYASSS